MTTDTTLTCKKCGQPLDPEHEGSEWIWIGWSRMHRGCVTWRDRVGTKNAMAAAFLVCAVLTTALAVLAITTGTGMPYPGGAPPTEPTGDWLTDTVDAAYGWFPALIALIFWGLCLSAVFSCG